MSPRFDEPPRPDQAQRGGAAASCSTASGSRSSPASGRAAGRTRCRSGSCPREGEVWIWTYAKSQKVRNLERDPRATVLVETGHEYGELRGAMIEAEAEIHRDFETVIGFAEELTLRYAEGISSVEGDAKAALEAQAPKRVAIQFRAGAHRDLGPPQARRHLLSRRRQIATSRPLAVLEGDATATFPAR